MTRADNIPRATAGPRVPQVGDFWCGVCQRLVPSPVRGVPGPYLFRRELHRLLDGCKP